AANQGSTVTPGQGAGSTSGGLGTYGNGSTGNGSTGNGYGSTGNGYGSTGNGYGSTGNGSTGNGYGSTGNGYGSTGNGYGSTGNGYGSYPNGSSGSGTASSSPAATTAQEKGVVTVDATLTYEEATSSGTGMILSAGGLVLTNNHVVDGATAIQVTDQSTGKQYTATVVGTDATADIALLQLKNAGRLTPIALDANASVADGADVTAIGNAEGTGTLVAASGSVTGTDQTMTAQTETGAGAETLDGLIEFQAAVVSGDSGGPLLDSAGRAVGMTTAASDTPGTAVAYAITIENALTVVRQIEAGATSGGITLGYPAFLGVELAASSSDATQGFGGFGSSGGYGSSGGLGNGYGTGTGGGSGTGSGTGLDDGTGTGTASGATIAGVISGTPAASAGMAAGDTVIAVGGKAVASSDALSSALAGYRPGDRVKITWVSGTTGATRSATVTLASGPAA
ncbi:MAG: trypsin-like peptidase domain-containing protein, partial [Micrococcales bacterium]|nr:trypsin-like peptidase domain-containing protein [Micrococcales bacterium]